MVLSDTRFHQRIGIKDAGLVYGSLGLEAGLIRRSCETHLFERGVGLPPPVCRSGTSCCRRILHGPVATLVTGDR